MNRKVEVLSREPKNKIRTKWKLHEEKKLLEGLISRIEMTEE